MHKKIIALCLICSIFGSSTAALATTNTNSKLNNNSSTQVSTTLPKPNENNGAYLGGGPSPSAAWTYKSSTVKRFSRSQIQSLYNQAWKAHQNGRLSETAYKFAITLAGTLGYGVGLTFTVYATFFAQTQFDLNQTTLNTLGRALACGHSSVAIEIKTWERPASGQRMCAFTKLP